jgi:hypothetical protein
VHLADTDLGRDLRLRETFEEPQEDDAPLPRREKAQQGRELLSALDAVELGVVLPEACAQVERAALLVGKGGVERGEAVDAAGLHRLEHVFHPRAGAPRDLLRRR